MNSDLIGSKKKSPMPSRDPAELDGSLGYVSVQEIRNVFTARIRDLDVDIWPLAGRMPSRAELLDFYTTTMIDLMHKAQRNYEQFCKRMAPIAPKAAPVQRELEVDPARTALEARKAKMEKWSR